VPAVFRCVQIYMGQALCISTPKQFYNSSKRVVGERIAFVRRKFLQYPSRSRLSIYRMAGPAEK
jgi:hypothetical protein